MKKKNALKQSLDFKDKCFFNENNRVLEYNRKRMNDYLNLIFKYMSGATDIDIKLIISGWNYHLNQYIANGGKI